MRDALRSVRRDNNTVGNRIPALPRNIDARLTRNRHARLENRVIAVFNPWRFVVLYANAVSLPMTQEIAHARVTNDIEALLVHIAAARADDERLCADFLGEAVHFIALSLFRSRIAEDKCTLAFREIAADKTRAAHDEILAGRNPPRGV